MSGVSATATALKKSAVSRYLQLAGHFRRRIETGEWPVGHRISTVVELAEECGVAGMTVRRALDILEGEGLIERFRAKGTFVREMPKKDLWCDIRTDWDALLNARYSSHIDVLSNELGPAPRFLASENWPGRPARQYRRLRRRYWREGAPFMLADVYIDETAFQALPEGSAERLTALRMVSDLPGRPIANAQQELTILSADLTLASELSVPQGAPMARMVRLAVDQDDIRVLVADGIYRGDSTKLRLKLK
ncbi:GntR family transcriptional regulator [Vannielia litorea]|uniref:GntR family transcriptional regulator n=1 Tax=Vannielia litorea TaxID=1217970 RepID=UPI001BD011E3|nr:GntR family transcriptional regulator [Vannielia litorea]MBS8225498.1 GntR family transcriptional regulator [Vannielia litorea]